MKALDRLQGIVSTDNMWIGIQECPYCKEPHVFRSSVVMKLAFCSNPLSPYRYSGYYIIILHDRKFQQWKIEPLFKARFHYELRKRRDVQKALIDYKDRNPRGAFAGDDGGYVERFAVTPDPPPPDRA